MNGFVRHYCLITLYIFSLWSLIQPSISYAQQLTYEVGHFSRDEGLRNHRVWDVLEHSSGFVYVGTPSGLDRFDGYRFYPIDLPEHPLAMTGTVGPRVSILLELPDQRILIIYDVLLTEKDYLLADIYNPKTGAIITTKVKAANTAKYIDPSNKPDVVDATKYHYFVDHTGEGVNYFPNMFDRKGNRLLTSPLGDSLMLELSDESQLDLTAAWQTMTEQRWGEGIDFEETIYFRTLNGLIKTDIYNSPFTTYLSNMGEDWQYSLSCRSIIEVGNDLILFSPEAEGVALLEENTGKLERISFKSKEDRKKVKVKNIRGATLQGDTILLVAVYEDGVYKLNLKDREAEYLTPDYKELDLATMAMIERSNGQLVVATKKKQLKQDGNFLFTYDSKSFQKDTIDSVSYLFSAGEYRFTFLLESQNGKLWIGTTHGLFLVDLEAEKILGAWYDKKQQPISSSRDFPENFVLEASEILALHETEEGLLWIGTENGGVNILNPKTNKVKVLKEEDGLANNIVCGIVPYQDGYWLSTYNGLSFYNTKTKEFRNFYREQGLPHNEFNRFSFFSATSGKIYMGGMNGFVGFDPKEVLKGEKEVKIHLSEASYFNNEGGTIIHENNILEGIPTISIPANYRNCYFNFALSDLHTAQQHTYTYRLVPTGQLFSQDNIPWISNGTNRKIQFDYLPSGTYELQVKGTSARGVKSDTYKLEISVEELFYKTSWFFGLIILGVVGIGYLFYRNRLENAVRMEKLRTQLSSDLHDDVGSLLSGVAYQMELLEYSVDDQHKTLVQQIASSSRRAMSQMRDVVWAMDSRKASLQDLVERMREFANELLEPLQIDYRFEEGVPLSKSLSSEQRHALLLIFKEFLTNTVKHAKATKVDIRLQQEGKFFELFLQDNGTGIAKSLGKISGQGLSNMQMRAEKIKADLKFINHGGFGIHLRLKLI